MNPDGGRATVEMDDGRVLELKPGNLYAAKPASHMS